MGTICNSVSLLLSKQADGELNDLETRRLTLHLGSCGACAGRQAEYQALNELLLAPEPILAPPYLWTRVRAAIIRRPEVKPGVWETLARRLRPAMIPLAAAAVVALAVITSSQLSRTIAVNSRDAAAKAVNIEPEESNVPVLIPDVPADTAQDSLDTH